MKRIGLEKTLLLVAVSFFVGQAVFAGTAFTKTHREEFGQLIADGVASEKQLRDELRKEIGLNDVTKDVEPMARNQRKSEVIDLGVQEIVVPTKGGLTAWHKKPATPNYHDVTEKRISQEMESIGD